MLETVVVISRNHRFGLGVCVYDDDTFRQCEEAKSLQKTRACARKCIDALAKKGMNDFRRRFVPVHSQHKHHA